MVETGPRLSESSSSLINSWNGFDPLETCVVGAVHDNDCHFEPEPNYQLFF